MYRQDDFKVFENQFWQVSLKMEKMWKQIYAQTFPSSQSRIMHTLDQNGPQKMSELAQALHITAGAVTTASTILIEKAYIARLQNEQDRRVIQLTLTEKGKKTLNELQKEGREMMQFVFQDLSDDELKKMQLIFKRAAARLDKL